jgi:polyisoprenoid-binding protein YceI
MLKVYLFALVSLFVTSNAFAQWALINEESTVNYVSIKKSQVAEVNSFKTLNGSIENNGNISVDIDLASVETNVPIRDERMKALFFEVATFPKATISTALDHRAITGMNIGDTYKASMKISLSLHGVSKEMVTDVRVVRLTKNRILAVSLKPVIVNADDFKLSEGVEKLREIAKLPSISSATPVTFSLVFSQQ